MNRREVVRLAGIAVASIFAIGTVFAKEKHDKSKDVWKQYVGKPGPNGWRVNVIQPDPHDDGPDGFVRLCTQEDTGKCLRHEDAGLFFSAEECYWRNAIKLAAGAKAALAECSVDPDNIVESEVPGSFELPLAARFLALSNTVDVIIPVGVLIQGETAHFELISSSVTKA